MLGAIRPRKGMARRTVLSVIGSVLLIGTLVVGPPWTPAAADIGPYNGTDGTLDTHSSVSLGNTDLTNSGSDNSYGGGAKEDQECPATGAGSIPPNKDDLHQFWTGNTGDYLYLAWSRTNTNGTATVEFELNQDDTGCGNGVNKERTVGDLLITFDFQGGDLDNIPIEVRTWDGTKWGPADELIDGVESEASISANLKFGELVIDLRAAGIFEDGECISFAAAFPKSRASSSSFSNQLKDFIGGDGISVSNCASITIVKDADPNGDTAFPFEFQRETETASTFDLVDDGAGPGVGSKTYSDLLNPTDDFLITEFPPNPTPGLWRLDDITCTGGTRATVISKDLTNNRVTVTPNGPVDITCTFENSFDPPPTVNVTKTANRTAVNAPGGPVTYTVVVHNTSTETVTITSLTDTVGNDVTDLLDPLLANNDCDALDDYELAPLDTVVDGGPDQVTCTFTVTLAGLAEGDVHENTVTVIVEDEEGDTATDTDDERVTVRELDVLVTKTALPTTLPEPGGSVTYTVLVENRSVDTVTVTSLVDVVTGGGTTDLLTLAGSSCSAANADLELSGADATAGSGPDTFTCTFTASVSGNAGDVHENTVTVIVEDADGNTAEDDDPAEVTLTNINPTIDVIKTADPVEMDEPGGLVEYTVTVVNLSNETVTITALTDQVLPDGEIVDLLDTALAGNECDALDGFVLAAASGADDDEVTCTFTATVTGNAGFVHTNRVTAVAVDGDPGSEPATDFDDAEVTLLDVAPEITVDKTADPGAVQEPGASVTYTVTVFNESAETVTLTSLTDVVAGGAPINVFTVSGTTCVSGVELGPDDSAAGGLDEYTCTFPLAVTGAGGTTVTDVVTAVVVDDDGTEADDFDDAVVRITLIPPTTTTTSPPPTTTTTSPPPPQLDPAINIVKTASEGVVRSGDEVVYRYVVTNTGEVALANVVVDDDQCSPVTFVSGDADGNELLDLNETWRYTCTDVLIQDTTNVAVATGEDPDGNEVDDQDEAFVDVINPAIAIDKTANVANATVGDTIVYSYVVTNPGDDPLSDVAVTDDKCSPLTFIDGDADGDGQLDVGETWNYTCSDVAEAAGQLTNVAVAVGTPTVGPDVDADDTVTVPVAQVLGEVFQKPPAKVAPAVLARTGSEAWRTTQLGVILFGLGVVLLAGARRRRIS